MTCDVYCIESLVNSSEKIFCLAILSLVASRNNVEIALDVKFDGIFAIWIILIVSCRYFINIYIFNYRARDETHNRIRVEYKYILISYR